MRIKDIAEIISQKRDIPLPLAKCVVSDVFSVLKDGLIDSDKVPIGDIGTIELQSMPPIMHNGKKKYTGRIIFKANQKTLKSLIESNLRMIEDEERE